MSTTPVHDSPRHRQSTDQPQAATSLRSELLLIVLIKLVALGMLWALMRSA
jgi:hypothetical protein